ncbi:MAG: protein-disulfide reductase DsbD [Gammaproteobacteria bacterium]
MKKFFALLLMLCWAPLCLAQNPLSTTSNTFIPTQQAFHFDATIIKGKTLKIVWDITPGYKLYRDQITIKTTANSKVTLGKFYLPDGIVKDDPTLGRTQLFTGQLKIAIPLKHVEKKYLEILVSYQGCSEQGVCYPPMSRHLYVALDPNMATQKLSPAALLPSTTSAPPEESKIVNLLQQHHFYFSLLSFFIFGFLLAFTPCVLPMLPILSTIILGQKQLTTGKAFILSLAYILGVATTYAIVGVIAGFIGHTIQAFMQSPIAILLFSILFIALAIALFGGFDIQMPEFIRSRIARFNDKLGAGTLLGVFAMGCLSLLIISPCVSAPLIGALTYIAYTRDILLGGSALFAMGLGMGTPLLLFGTFGARFIPKSGIWMITIKRAFGVLMLALAIWLLSRLLPGEIILGLWGVLAIVVAIVMGALRSAKNTWRRIERGIGVALLVYGVCMLIGAALGNTDPLKPFHSQPTCRDTVYCRFVQMNSIEELQQALTIAKASQQPALIFFYADWCPVCHELIDNVFTHRNVIEYLQDYVLLQVNMTVYNPRVKVMMAKYQVIAPPVIVLFDQKGNMRTDRIVGYVSPDKFLRRISSS